MAEKKTHKPKARANGEGTLFKRSDGLWVGRLPNGYKPNGSVKYIQFTGKNQGDVLKKMDLAKAEVRTNTYREPNKVTVKDWFENWLNVTIKSAVKNTTWLSYEAMIRLHIVPSIGGIKLQKLQPSHLQGFYNDMLEGGREDKQKNKETGKLEKRKGGLSPKTIRYIHTIIYSALEQAVLEKIIIFNIAGNKAVRLPKNPKKEMKTLEISEVEKFLDRARLSRYFAAYYLELYTGLRRGELLGIRWKDIDLKNGNVKVVQQLVKVGTKHEIRELKTESSQDRVISIPNEVIMVLRDHRAKQEIELRHRGLNDLKVAEYFKTGLVFITEEGNIVQPRCFGRYFKSILKTAKVKSIRFHDMRHTFARLSLQSGADIKTLQSDLGHESIKTTLDNYGHVNEEMKRDAANKRSQLLRVVTSKS